MTTLQLLRSGVHFLGKTYQEVSDVHYNGKVLIKNFDLFKAGYREMSQSEYNEFKQLDFSRLFILDRARYSIEIFKPVDPNCKERLVQLTPIDSKQPSPLFHFFSESILRISKGIVVIALAIFSSPVWFAMLAITSVGNYRTVPIRLSISWTSGRDATNYMARIITTGNLDEISHEASSQSSSGSDTEVDSDPDGDMNKTYAILGQILT